MGAMKYEDIPKNKTELREYERKQRTAEQIKKLKHFWMIPIWMIRALIKR